MPSSDDLPADAPTGETRRAVCPRCERPISACYCAALVTLETRTRVVLLQHPRERGMPFGTARMASLCLPQSSLHVGAQWDDGEVLRSACEDPERPPILLHPGPGARDIIADPPEGPVTLIVLDGTWSQTRSMVRANPKLAALPRYAFTPPEPSRYRIRREPEPEYVSTIEALAYVLGALEGDAEPFRALVRLLDAMVDAHLEAQGGRRNPRCVTTRPRLSPYERLPHELREGRADLVLAFGDANAWPRGAPERRHGDELVYWVAHRPSTRETFSFVIAPRIALSPEIPRHTELPAEDLLAGGSVADLFTAFEAFVRPGDVLASWGFHGVRLLRECGGELPGSFVDMHQVARSLTKGTTGSIERYAASIGVAPRPGHPLGRAGRRLGLLVSVLDAWRALPRVV